MNNQLKLTGLLLSGALVGSVVTSWLGQSAPQAAAQDAAAPQPGPVFGPPADAALPVYRYQMVGLGERRFGIIDTRTGRCWTGDTYGNTLTYYGPLPHAEKP